MRRVTIHDANILIDLTNLKLTKEFFELDFEFHTTDLALNEIAEGLQKEDLEILKLHLKIKTFNPQEFRSIIRRHKSHRTLSIPDISILELAISLKGILCTGDKSLRKIAKKKGIEIHGTLWVVKQIFIAKKISSKKAIRKLKELESINSRIPKQEIQKLKEIFKHLP